MLYESHADFQDLIDLIGGWPCKLTIEPLEGDKLRTSQQNKSIHKYCDQLAKAYNDAGLDMKTVIDQQAEIPWSMERVKENQWRQIQTALGMPSSTTKLVSGEVTQVYEVLNRHTSSSFGISISFPSLDSLMFNQPTTWRQMT